MPRTCKEGAISTGLIFPITHRVPGTGTTTGTPTI